jgi:type I restriction-modification system DNA methylase subunit
MRKWLELRDPKRAAEIFTPPQLVREMLDQLPPDQWLPGKTFLEPSCGNGNFLVEIVAYKLNGGCTPLQAIADIYAVELMADGVLVSRYRTLRAAGLLGNKEAEKIVERQIRQGDALKDPLDDDGYWQAPQLITFEDLKDTIEANIPYLKEMGVLPFEVLKGNAKKRRERARYLPVKLY